MTTIHQWAPPDEADRIVKAIGYVVMRLGDGMACEMVGQRTTDLGDARRTARAAVEQRPECQAVIMQAYMVVEAAE